MDRTEIAVRRQVTAMGSTVFEVGLYKPDAGGEPVMIPRVWDQDALLRSIGWLRLQNMQGRNIYIRPKGEHDLSLVDDLKPESIARMKAGGFQPAAIVETSPGNFQAWLKHPTGLPREVSTAAARELASLFHGDLGAADWRHFGRLGGFTNRKPIHTMEDGRFPFVQVVESTGERYSAGSALLKKIEQKLREAQVKREQMSRTADATTIKTIDAFWSNPLYSGDHTRSDLAYAIYALAHGSSEEHVANAIRTRDLSHKGNEKRQGEYVERTLKKASSLLSRAYAR
jgi:hypothetical protein